MPCSVCLVQKLSHTVVGVFLYMDMLCGLRTYEVADLAVLAVDISD